MITAATPESSCRATRNFPPWLRSAAIPFIRCWFPCRSPRRPSLRSCFLDQWQCFLGDRLHLAHRRGISGGSAAASRRLDGFLGSPLTASCTTPAIILIGNLILLAIAAISVAVRSSGPAEMPYCRGGWMMSTAVAVLLGYTAGTAARWFSGMVSNAAARPWCFSFSTGSTPPRVNTRRCKCIMQTLHIMPARP